MIHIVDAVEAQRKPFDASSRPILDPWLPLAALVALACVVGPGKVVAEKRYVCRAQWLM